MKDRRLSSKFFSAAVCLIMVAVVAIASASAQTKKKKKRPVRKAAATKTVPRTTDDAGVISLADQYQDSSSQIIAPTATSSKTELSLSDDTSRKLRDMQTRIKKLESPQKNDYDERQKRLLTNLDILTKAEQRSESLRKQRFELMEKENAIRSRIDQIDADSRPEVIEKSVAIAGTLRPEELREARRRSLDAEKRNLQSLLNEVSATRANLDQNVVRADALVEKLRTRLEKDIDDALDSKEPEQ